MQISHNIIGALKPYGIIPFKFSKEQAGEAFKKWCIHLWLYNIILWFVFVSCNLLLNDFYDIMLFYFTSLHGFVTGLVWSKYEEKIRDKYFLNRKKLIKSVFVIKILANVVLCICVVFCHNKDIIPSTGDLLAGMEYPMFCVSYLIEFIFSFSVVMSYKEKKEAEHKQKYIVHILDILKKIIIIWVLQNVVCILFETEMFIICILVVVGVGLKYTGKESRKEKIVTLI